VHLVRVPSSGTGGRTGDAAARSSHADHPRGRGGGHHLRQQRKEDVALLAKEGKD
jgi:hypothetical protein